jgi:hypothetical protein
MSNAPPLLCAWDGESFVPFQSRLADKHFTVGESYPLIVHEPRSHASHNHFFALVAEAHQNLPEDLAERLPTPEHLRKYALIRAGYRDERSISCASKAEALRVAAFVKPMDEFAVVAVVESVVTVYTAKSQSLRSMGARVFAESKEAVLNVLAGLIGVDPTTLSRSSHGQVPAKTETGRPAAKQGPPSAGAAGTYPKRELVA